MSPEPHRVTAADFAALDKSPHQLCLSRQSYGLLCSLQFSSGSTIIPSLVKCVDLKLDCAFIADADKYTNSVNGRDSQYQPVSSQRSRTTAAINSISIAVSNKVDCKKTALTTDEDLGNY